MELPNVPGNEAIEVNRVINLPDLLKKNAAGVANLPRQIYDTYKVRIPKV